MAAPIQPALIERGSLLSDLTGAGKMMKELVFRNVNIGPFSGDKFAAIPLADLLQPPVVPVAGPNEHDLHSIVSFNYMRAGRWPGAKNLTVAETMIPDLAPDSWLAEAPSRDELVRVFKSYGAEHGLGSWDAGSNAIKLYSTVGVVADGAPGHGRVAIPLADVQAEAGCLYKAVIPPTLVPKVDAQGNLVDFVQDLTPEECAWCLGVLGASPTRNILTRAREALCEFIIMMCKQGNVSDRWLSRVAADVSSNFGDSVNLDRERITALYGVFGDHNNERTMSHISTNWVDKIAVNGIRLKTILRQAAGAGVTGLQIIGDAMVKHPNFNWVGAVDVIGIDQMTRANNARNTFRGRPYVGYNNVAMDAHGLKHYRKLAWLARAILIEVDGEESLATYRGIPSEIPESVTLRPAIAAYRAARMGVIPAAGAASAGAAAAYNTIPNADWAHVTGV